MKFCKVTAIIRPECLDAVVEECMNKLIVPGIGVARVKSFGEHANFFKSDWLCQHVRD